MAWTEAKQTDLLTDLEAGVEWPRHWGEFLGELDRVARLSLRTGTSKHRPVHLPDADVDDAVQEFLIAKDGDRASGSLLRGFDASFGQSLAVYLCAFFPGQARDCARRKRLTGMTPMTELREWDAAVEEKAELPVSTLRPELRFREFRKVTNPRRVLGMNFWRRLAWEVPPHPELRTDIESTLASTEQVSGLEYRLDTQETSIREIQQKHWERRRDLTEQIIQVQREQADDPDRWERECELQRWRAKAERRLEDAQIREFLPLVADDVESLLAISRENAWQQCHRARAQLPRLVEADGELGVALEELAKRRIGASDDDDTEDRNDSKGGQ